MLWQINRAMNSKVCERIFLMKNLLKGCRYFSCVSRTNYILRKDEQNNKNQMYRYPHDIRACSISTQPYLVYFTPANPIISFTMDMLQKIHDTTGLPWWATIILTTVTCRTFITLPFTIRSHKNLASYRSFTVAKYGLEKQVLHEVWTAVQKKEIPITDSKKEFQTRMTEKTKELYKVHNYRPFRIAHIVMIQIPLWTFLSASYKHLSDFSVGGQETSVACQSLLTEGALWFTDLTVADPTYALPVLLGLLNLTISEIHMHLDIKEEGKNKVHKVLPNIVRACCILFIPLAAVMPSSVAYYWVISSSFGLVQAVLLKMPKVRRLVGIPKTDAESETPFKDIFKQKKFFTQKHKNKDGNSGEKL